VLYRYLKQFEKTVVLLGNRAKVRERSGADGEKKIKHAF
jgi:hypothetical protein